MQSSLDSALRAPDPRHLDAVLRRGALADVRAAEAEERARRREIDRAREERARIEAMAGAGAAGAAGAAAMHGARRRIDPLPDAAWLFAIDSRYGIARTDGRVTSWRDRVHGHIFTPPLTNNAPRYIPSKLDFGSKPAVLFYQEVGVRTEYMTCSTITSTATAWTIYAVVDSVSTQAIQEIVRCQTGRLVYYSRSGTDQLATFDSVARVYGTATAATGRMQLTYQQGGSASEAWKDGVSQGTAGYAAKQWGGVTGLGCDGVAPSAASGLQGHIAFVGVVAGGRDAAIESYLDDRFGDGGGASAFRVVILAGQSNAQGNDEEAQLTDQTLLADYSAVPEVYRIGPNAELLDGATGGLGATRSAGDWGFGMELKLARDLDAAKTVGDEIAVCKVARGSRGADRWLPATPGEQWLWLVERWDTLCKALRARDPSKRIVPIGVVWSQGETDAASEAAGDLYQGRLETIIAGVRELTQAADLYWQIVLLNPNWVGDPAGEVAVRAAQEAIVAADANVDAIDADALGYYTTGAKTGHYTADALMTQGATAAANLVAKGVL